MPVVETNDTRPAQQSPGTRRQMLDRLGRIFLNPLLASQGLHIDPEREVEPDPELWSKDRQEVWFSVEMKLFRDCLRHDGMDVRGTVLDELSRYYGLTADEALHRCLHWEEWSVDEWRAGNRSTPEALQDFYNSVQSWSFDLLWYAYLQASGFGIPVLVAAARFAREKCPGGRHLDFGSGVGVTSQLFARLGFDTTCADVSKTLLDFTKWRFDRRGDRAHFLDMTSGELAQDRYDIVTAVDTLTYVPDFDATAHALHRAVRPGGWLLTNFDVRKKGAEESAWHLYQDDLDLELRLQRVGFVRRGMLCGMLLCYQRVDPHSIAHRMRTIRDRLVLGPPVGMIIAALRRIKWPTSDRILRLLRRATR